jgi:hypothetical protein
LGDAMSLLRQGRAIDLFIACQPSEILNGNEFGAFNLGVHWTLNRLSKKKKKTALITKLIGYLEKQKK